MKIYTVGGAVRDKILGVESTDTDYVVVGSSVEEMLSLGFKQVGAHFPVFLHPVTGDEYALARTEKKVGEGYSGFICGTENVTLEEDLSRRDFTFNAMAMDDEGNITDPYGGQKDLLDFTIRHVGPAFSEDPLRILRCIRFAVKYNFNIADETAELIKVMLNDGQLNTLPPERIYTELRRTVEYAMTAEYKWDRLTELFHEFKLSNHSDVLAHVSITSKCMSNDLDVAMGCLFDTHVHTMKFVPASVKNARAVWADRLYLRTDEVAEFLDRHRCVKLEPHKFKKMLDFDVVEAMRVYESVKFSDVAKENPHATPAEVAKLMQQERSTKINAVCF